MHQLCFIYCSIFMLCVFIFENRFWFNKRFVLQHYAEKWKKKRPFSLLRQSQVLYTRFRFTTIMPVVHLWKWKLIFFLSIAVSSLRSEEDKNKKKQNKTIHPLCFCFSLSIAVYLIDIIQPNNNVRIQDES